jgi:hypothetical protein
MALNCPLRDAVFALGLQEFIVHFSEFCGTGVSSSLGLPENGGTGRQREHERRDPGDDDRSMASRPLDCALEETWPARSDRLVFQKSAQVIAQVSCRDVASRRGLLHRFQDDGFEISRYGGIDPSWW